MKYFVCVSFISNSNADCRYWANYIIDEDPIEWFQKWKTGLYKANAERRSFYSSVALHFYSAVADNAEVGEM